MNLTFSAGIAVQILALFYGVCSLYTSFCPSSNRQGSMPELNGPIDNYRTLPAKNPTPDSFAGYTLKSGKVLAGKVKDPAEKVKIRLENCMVTNFFYKDAEKKHKIPEYFYNVRPENHNVRRFFHNGMPGNQNVSLSFYPLPQNKLIAPFLCLFSGFRLLFPVVHPHSKWYINLFWRYGIFIQRYAMIYSEGNTVISRYDSFFHKFNIILRQPINFRDQKSNLSFNNQKPLRVYVPNYLIQIILWTKVSMNYC